MERSIRYLQPDSTDQPDTSPAALQKLYDKLWADWNAPRSPDLTDEATAQRILDGQVPAIRAGRAAQASGDGQ
jgi:hypothetical protein